MPFTLDPGDFDQLAQRYPQSVRILAAGDTQGLLSDHHRRNEIHPNAEGFKLISMAIERQMLRAYQDD